MTANITGADILEEGEGELGHTLIIHALLSICKGVEDDSFFLFLIAFILQA